MTRSRLFFLLAAGVVVIAAWLWFLPPRWWLNTIKPVDLSDPAAAGASVVAAYECRKCHLIDGQGKALGPDLTGVTQRLDAVSLRQWLRDPRGIKWDTPMPNFHLSDPEIEAVTAYLIHVDGTGD